jgi:hypothetical protein
MEPPMSDLERAMDKYKARIAEFGRENADLRERITALEGFNRDCGNVLQYWYDRYQQLRQAMKDVSDLTGLHYGTRGQLANNNIFFRSQLTELIDDELLALEGIGRKRVAEIRAWLKEQT